MSRYRITIVPETIDTFYPYTITAWTGEVHQEMGPDHYAFRTRIYGSTEEEARGIAEEYIDDHMEALEKDRRFQQARETNTKTYIYPRENND